MISFHNYIIIVAAISAAISGAKKIKTFMSTCAKYPIFLYFFIINLIAEMAIETYIAYKYPFIFVSWIIVNDPLIQYIITMLIKK